MYIHLSIRAQCVVLYCIVFSLFLFHSLSPSLTPVFFTAATFFFDDLAEFNDVSDSLPLNTSPCSFNTLRTQHNHALHVCICVYVHVYVQQQAKSKRVIYTHHLSSSQSSRGDGEGEGDGMGGGLGGAVPVAVAVEQCFLIGRQSIPKDHK